MGLVAGLGGVLAGVVVSWASFGALSLMAFVVAALIGVGAIVLGRAAKAGRRT